MTAPPLPLRPSQLGRACEVLAAAFHDDPAVRFLLPHEPSRNRWLRWLHDAGLRHVLPEGHVYTAGDDELAGAIGLVPPGRYPLPAARYLRYLMRLLPRLPSGGFPLGRVVSALQAQALLDRLHPKERHWYVYVLGVHPDRQGKGLGGALLEPALEMADRDGLPAYLETANPVNLGFYGRFGFEVVRKVGMPGGGPPVWTMLRPPLG